MVKKMINIQKARKKDALQIAIVNVYTWKTQYEELIPKEVIDFRIDNIEHSAEKIRARIKEDGRYLVAKKEDTVIGFCRYGKSNFGDYGEVHALYVLKGFNKKGIGRLLFESAKEELKKMGFSKFRVNCLRGNPTLNFYIHMGGILSGEFENEVVGHKIKEDILFFDV